MEPIGLMDTDTTKSAAVLQLQRSSSSGGGGGGKLQLCDMADEEVHFSRQPPDSPLYYYYNHQNQLDQSEAERGAIYNQISGDARPEFGFTTTTTKTSTAATNASQPADSDQATSSRLLSSLSSRLRRGSNLLNASQVVGQYLLGITIQSWGEFFNTARMLKAPCTRHQLARRLASNLSYFQGNYLCVSLVLVIYCILSSPALLVVIVAYLLGLYAATARSALGKQTRLLRHKLNLQQQYSLITMLALPPLWIAGAPSALFWVIGASFFVVGLHAALYANERALVAEPSGAHSVLSLQASYGAANGQKKKKKMMMTKVEKTKEEEEEGKGEFSPEEWPPDKPVGRLNHCPNSNCHTSTGFSSLMSAYQAPEPSSKRHSIGGGAYSALSSWIPFGGGGGHATGRDLEAAAGAKEQQARAPEVKIISQDYAGLGRVYEV